MQELLSLEDSSESLVLEELLIITLTLLLIDQSVCMTNIILIS